MALTQGYVKTKPSHNQTQTLQKLFLLPGIGEKFVENHKAWLHTVNLKKIDTDLALYAPTFYFYHDLYLITLDSFNAFTVTDTPQSVCENLDTNSTK